MNSISVAQPASGLTVNSSRVAQIVAEWLKATYRIVADALVTFAATRQVSALPDYLQKDIYYQG